MELTHTVACFLRIDLRVEGQPQEDLYDRISDRLQNIVMESSVGSGEDGLDLEASTCVVLGPLEGADELANLDPGEEFDILLEHIEWETDEDDDE